MLKAKWQGLNPRSKRIVLIAVVSAIAVGFISVVSKPKEDVSRSSRNDVIKHVLTDRDTRTIGLESLAADLKSLRQENLDLRRKVDRLETDAKGRPPVQPDETYRAEIDTLKDELQILKQEAQELKYAVPPTGSSSADETVVAVDDATSYGSQSPFATSASGQEVGPVLDPTNPNSIFETSSWPKPSVLSASPVTAEAGRSGETVVAAATPSSIKRHTRVVEVAEEEDAKAAAAEEMLFLPAGSIITGTFLNGIDAPTGQGARRDPFPSTLRIQKEAILPNRFRADIRECFLIVSGYGDLSSERAYLRGETISCVREDGGVIETNLDSYAVGEDGKAGVRGRLVSKQGQIIARSLMAGFLSGVSKAFDVKPVPVIETSNSGSANYSRNKPDTNWLQSSAVSGAGSALDRIADFYLEMAEGMFPVIEIDAGRQIDVIVSRGANLQIRSKAPGTSGRGISNRTER